MKVKVNVTLAYCPKACKVLSELCLAPERVKLYSSTSEKVES